MAIYAKDPPAGSPGSQSVTSTNVIADGAMVAGDGGARGIKGTPNTIDSLGRITIPANGGSMLPATRWTGTPFSGTGSTSLPLVFIEPAGTTPYASFNAAGTFVGVNVDNTFVGYYLQFTRGGQVNFIVQQGGSTTLAGAAYLAWANRCLLQSPSTGKLLVNNGALNSGYLLDGTTDSVLRVRTRADDADARVQCNDLVLSKTITPGGTTGNATINAASGSVNFAAAAGSLTLTNSLITTSSVLSLALATNDTTCTGFRYTPGNGSVVIRPNGIPAAECRCDFRITN